MPEMLDFYIDVCLKVTGKNLEAKRTNTIIDYHTSSLRDLKIVEDRENGKVFKAWVVGVDEFKHELLSKDLLLLSRRVRFEVRDPLPHGDNRMNYIQAKIHKALMGIKVHDKPDCSDEILIKTTNTHISGNSRTGRWPRSELDGAFR